MDYQGFTGIADADSLGFRIKNYIKSHGRICAFIHIDMTVAGSRFNDRHGGLLYHSADQACAAPGNQYIHVLVQLHKFSRSLMTGICNQLNGI